MFNRILVASAIVSTVVFVFIGIGTANVFDCKSPYPPHDAAMTKAINKLNALQGSPDTNAIACATANGIRVGIWFMEKCDKSSLTQIEEQQLIAQVAAFRESLKQSIDTYNATNASNKSCTCDGDSDIEDFCMD